uniref:Uncharacterized protein n=1 Tax=Pipistrellus kuhlii TaxID=59472 RepID=A0A7J8A7X6_PIPKU|nr:hypothetical protein mPipKuh1_008896 [Pipistrellus kuhlii]
MSYIKCNFSSHSGCSSSAKVSSLLDRKVFTSSKDATKRFSTSPLDSHRTLLWSRRSEYMLSTHCTGPTPSDSHTASPLSFSSPLCPLCLLFPSPFFLFIAFLLLLFFSVPSVSTSLSPRSSLLLPSSEVHVQPALSDITRCDVREEAGPGQRLCGCLVTLNRWQPATQSTGSTGGGGGKWR